MTMDEDVFLRVVYDVVKRNPGIAVRLQDYARKAIEDALAEARAQATDMEAALKLQVGNKPLKAAALEKLRKWDGRLAFGWFLK